MLGTILVLAALITAFLEIARKEIILQGMYVGRSPMELTAWSAFESTIGVLNTYLQIDGGLYGPAQGWGDPLNQKAWGNSTSTDPGNIAVIYAPPDGMTVNVTVTDYTGLMPLNRMSDNEFLAMFDTMQIDPTQGQILLDTFRDWTQPYTGNFTSDGAGPDYYETLSPGYDPTYTNITDFDEFHYLKTWQDLFWDANGTETPLYQQFRSMVTLHDSGGPVNLNTAPTAVLDVLADQFLVEIDEPTLESYLWGADGIPNTPDDMMIRNTNEETTAGVLSTNGTSGNSTTGNTTGGAASGGVTGANTNSIGNSATFAALAVGGGGGGGQRAGVQRAAVVRAAAAREVAGAQPVALVGAAARVAVDVAPVAVPRGGLPVVVVQPAVVGRWRQQELAVELRAVLAAEQRVAVLRVAAVLRVGQPVLEERGTGAAATTSTTTTNVGVGFLARLLKINITITLGDSHFLLSVIVQPNNVGTGVPTSVSSGGGSGGGGFTATTTNTTGSYPFSIVAYAENYDIP